MLNPSIYDWIREEESRFESDEIQVGSNWMWSFRIHVQLIFHLKNGVFYTGQNDYLRAVKNIMEPILNLDYWTEDIELKDVVFYIENEQGRILSFLIKKYHDEVYVKEHNLDTFFDELTESDLDYGGVLVQKTVKETPEVIDLNTIAFCDQTDMLGGPIGIKLNLSPSKLRSMEKRGWGKKENGANISISELITLAQPEKDVSGDYNSKKNKTSGKTIDLYVVHGYLPEAYLEDNDNMEDYSNQLHIVGFYTDEKNKKKGVTLYRKPEKESTLKFYTSKKVTNRALGRGEGEALIHPQVWTNCLTIWKHDMLEAGSKVPLVTDDASYSNRNKIRDMENLEVTVIEDGKTIRQIPTVAPANVQLFMNSINEWYEYAQLAGSAFDPILGQQPISGTTFRGQERNVAQGAGLHQRRKGQRAKFIEEIYRDSIITDIKKSILGGKKFLATLTSDEMGWISDQLADNHAHRERVEDVLNGKIPRDKEVLRQEFLASFRKAGNKQLIEILADEFEDVEVKMGINVAGKSNDLAQISDKVLSIFQFAFQNIDAFQRALQNPAMAKMFNEILEFSGLNQADFTTLIGQPLPSPIQSSELSTGAPAELALTETA